MPNINKNSFIAILKELEKSYFLFIKIKYLEKF